MTFMRFMDLIPVEPEIVEKTGADFLLPVVLIGAVVVVAAILIVSAMKKK